MISWFSNEDSEWLEGFGYALGLTAVATLKLYCFRRGLRMVFLDQIISMQVVTHAIMSKVVKLSSSVLGIVEMGPVTSLLSADAAQLMIYNFYINLLVMVPVVVIAITLVLVYEFGYVCVITPVVFILLVWV